MQHAMRHELCILKATDGEMDHQLDALRASGTSLNNSNMEVLLAWQSYSLLKEAAYISAIH